MRRVVLFIGMLLLASVSPLVAADVVAYSGDNAQDSVIVSDDIFARLVEFNEGQRLAVERRKAIIDSLEAKNFFPKNSENNLRSSSVIVTE